MAVDGPLLSQMIGYDGKKYAGMQILLSYAIYE